MLLRPICGPELGFGNQCFADGLAESGKPLR